MSILGGNFCSQRNPPTRALLTQKAAFSLYFAPFFCLTTTIIQACGFRIVAMKCSECQQEDSTENEGQLLVAAIADGTELASLTPHCMNGDTIPRGRSEHSRN